MKSISKKMSLVLELSSLQAHLSKRIEQQLSIHGISFTELLVMHRLHGAPNQTMRRIDLAETVGLSASGITRLLKPMEKMLWIEKETNPRDARVSLVRLSHTGKTLYQDAFITCTQSTESLLEPLSGAQVAEFLDLIKTIH